MTYTAAQRYFTALCMRHLLITKSDLASKPRGGDGFSCFTCEIAGQMIKSAGMYTSTDHKNSVRCQF